jgi:hypothetical protein
MLVDGVKEMWHRDLVDRPDTHAWVLSLYRAGELHPQTVDDYFPLAAAEDATLRDEMARHAADEVKHVKIYDRAITKLGETRTEAEGLDVFNVVIRRETNASFAMTAELTDDARRERLAHFLAHAHFLEKRIARSLGYHLDACDRAKRTDVMRAVGAVHADEGRHTRYTLAGVHDLLPRARAERVIETHRRGERRANLRFSARQVRGFLERFGAHTKLSHAVIYRTCAAMMEAGRAAI